MRQILLILLSCLSTTSCGRHSATRASWLFSTADSQPKALAAETSSQRNTLIITNSPDSVFASSRTWEWTKYVVTLNDGSSYFMNAKEQKYHYEFATQHIPQFRNLSVAEFERVSLSEQDRKAIIGDVFLVGRTVLFDIVSNNVVPVEQVIEILKILKSSTKHEDGMELEFRYLPTPNQRDEAEKHKDQFEREGFALATPQEYASSQDIYSEGWAIGRFVRTSSDTLMADFLAGKIKRTDVVITDRVPTEAPSFAGLIVTEPATPASHVVLMSQSLKRPFGYYSPSLDFLNIEALLGKRVFFLTAFSMLRLRDVSLYTDEDLRRLHAAVAPRIDFPAKESYKLAAGKIFKKASAMQASDLRYFGGKSIHFKVLHNAIPNNYPSEAFGFSFDLWDAFMQQTLPTGETLLAQINATLGDIDSADQSPLLVKEKLAAVRKLIKKAPFPELLRDDILAVLRNQRFSTSKKIRFRSSTNLEDLATFNGAGMYDSFSGCLGDELNTSEVSVCEDSNPSGTSKPVTVIKAIQKVFASFYNDEAFLVRERLKIDDAQVGMAILVHYSTPDDLELANGVIVTTVNTTDKAIEIIITSQPTGESVTNPVSQSQPETVRLYMRSTQGQDESGRLVVENYSRAVPYGQLLLQDEKMYKDLATLAKATALSFRRFEDIQSQSYRLDMEYKLVRDGDSSKLVIKQVRSLPTESIFQPEKLFLLGRRVAMCPMQSGDLEDVWPRIMGSHFLKSRGVLELRTDPISSVIQDQNYIVSGQLEFINDGTAFDVSQLQRSAFSLEPHEVGSVAELTFRGQETVTIMGMQHDIELYQNTYVSLRLPVLLASYPSVIPSTGSGALELIISSKNDSAEYGGSAKNITTRLYACDENPPSAEVQNSVTDVGEVKVEVTYQFSRESVLWTEQNLAAWGHVSITGLTSEVLNITSDAARTYAGSHHNFSEYFLFEPARDPSISAALRGELKRKNIKAVFVEAGTSVRVIGFDETVRNIGHGKPMTAIPLPGGSLPTN